MLFPFTFSTEVGACEVTGNSGGVTFPGVTEGQSPSGADTVRATNGCLLTVIAVSN